MYTKSNPSPPPVPPKNYSGTMYQSPPRAPTPPPEIPPERESPCESCKFAPPPPQEGCEEKKPGLFAGLLGESGINIGTEELLLIGLILLLYSSGADNDVIIMLAVVLLAGFI